MCGTSSPATIYSDLEHENATLDRCSAMTTASYEAQTVHTNVLASTAQAEGIAAGLSSTAAPTPKRMTRAYEGFLELPHLVVLALLWVAGAVLLGSCALGVYMVGSLLVRVLAGAL